MYIERQIQKVVERQKKRKSVIVITGSRQVGKSTMLKKILGDDGFKHVTLDNLLIRERAIENPISFLEIYKPPVIIDEIQKAPILLEYIKEKVDNNKEKGQYYLTSSQSYKLMQGVSEDGSRQFFL